MINLVEMIADESEPAPCKWGNIVPGHACYCHNDDATYRKCPIWNRGMVWNKLSCEWFEESE